MHLIPYLEHRIYSSKSPEEICTALKIVTKSREETSYRPYIEFIGEIRPLEFELMNNICFRNDFTPMISGKIWTDGNSSVIDITMRLQQSVSVWSLFGFMILVLFFFIALIGSLATGEFETAPFMALIFVTALHQLILRVGFYIPARQSIQKLEKLFC